MKTKKGKMRPNSAIIVDQIKEISNLKSEIKDLKGQLGFQKSSKNFAVEVVADQQNEIRILKTEVLGLAAHLKELYVGEQAGVNIQLV